MKQLMALLVGLAGSLVLRALNLTLRWRVIGLAEGDRYWACSPPRILAFWHSQQLMMPWTYLNARRRGLSRRIAALISQHQDGRMIASGMRFLGIDTVSGSSTRRGREALYEMLGKLKNGSHVGITPDGPRGPVNRVKGGIIRLAQRSGAGIFPAAVSFERCWRFGSWDRMILPKPFSRAVLALGEMIFVPAEITQEEFLAYSRRLEAALNEATSRAQEALEDA